jgi:hypothetical protein
MLPDQLEVKEKVVIVQVDFLKDLSAIDQFIISRVLFCFAPNRTTLGDSDLLTFRLVFYTWHAYCRATNYGIKV